MEEEKSYELECNEMECSEMFDFLMEFQEHSLSKLNKLFSRKSELECKKEKLKIECFLKEHIRNKGYVLFFYAFFSCYFR